ncbi:MAG: hypothetical protein BJ554DRAFT_7318 [Olpidium bornovanus]|uniref:Uncharacterized protein n=1 Tax=Olpidium bornovanus TaxID=278681 RepID=A0A8H8DM71_9FUNG|nr:MAG: hypothetical protein BJ554DRAFT_7318 [Olpidium bornovanus]
MLWPWTRCADADRAFATVSKPVLAPNLAAGLRQMSASPTTPGQVRRAGSGRVFHGSAASPERKAFDRPAGTRHASRLPFLSYLHAGRAPQNLRTQPNLSAIVSTYRVPELKAFIKELNTRFGERMSVTGNKPHLVARVNGFINTRSSAEVVRIREAMIAARYVWGIFCFFYPKRGPCLFRPCRAETGHVKRLPSGFGLPEKHLASGAALKHTALKEWLRFRSDPFVTVKELVHMPVICNGKVPFMTKFAEPCQRISSCLRTFGLFLLPSGNGRVCMGVIVQRRTPRTSAFTLRFR